MEVKRIEKNWFSIGEDWEVNLTGTFSLPVFYQFSGFDIYDGAKVYSEKLYGEVPAEIRKSAAGLKCEF